MRFPEYETLRKGFVQLLYGGTQTMTTGQDQIFRQEEGSWPLCVVADIQHVLQSIPNPN